MPISALLLVYCLCGSHVHKKWHILTTKDDFILSVNVFDTAVLNNWEFYNLQTFLFLEQKQKILINFGFCNLTSVNYY